MGRPMAATINRIGEAAVLLGANTETYGVAPIPEAVADAEGLRYPSMYFPRRTDLKTVRDACELQPNALSIKLSDQIEQLDQLITAEGDGTEFFEKTKITQGMQDLISEGVARLAGASSQAVFHLKQAMGGGKTHLLVGFGLLAKHPELRKAYCGGTLYGSAFGSARTAAFNGRNNPDHFFWGEIAGQLGKGEHFRSFWTSGPKAPDEKDWLKLFDGGEPILILFDEMPPYFHYLDTQKVGNGTVADIATRAFANLLTAAGKKSNVCVVVSGGCPAGAWPPRTEHHAGRPCLQRDLRHSPQTPLQIASRHGRKSRHSRFIRQETGRGKQIQSGQSWRRSDR